MAIICFIIDIGIELYSLLDPETLVLASSEEGGDSAKINVSVSSKKRGDLSQ